MDKSILIRNVLSPIFRFRGLIAVGLYRLTGGVLSGSLTGLPVLLLTTVGRKSGKQRTTPVGYMEQDGNYVVSASNSGFAAHPAWFHNLESNPRVTVQVGSRHLTAVAEPAQGALRQQLWAKLVKRAPVYGFYAKRTTREIPIVVLRPASRS